MPASLPSVGGLVATLFVFMAFLPAVAAFGAGDIPDFAFLQDKAYRHGDIENILEHIARWSGHSGGHGFGGGGFIGAAAGLIAAAARGGGGPKFSKMDVKRVYFGNWLRDYSQAIDIAGLSKASAETIVLVLSVLSFMTFGYATEEFQLTADRLGAYSTVEHIDNPRGYAAKEGDARQYHPKLRPPVDPRELEIDGETGMKNYIAKEGESFDTSAGHVRRSLRKAIELARRSGGRDSPDLFEAYRLLGGALHTLEDLLAHSNWVELSLRKLGCHDVFCHVGENITVTAGGEQVPPLVTGTFGSADFMFSVMGEAQDKLSESSINELSKRMKDAKNKNEKSPLEIIKAILNQLPSSEGKEQRVQKAEEIKQNAIHFDPDHWTTEEVQRQLWDALVWRDGVMRDVSRTIENIPGLSALMEQLTEALNVYIYTILEPYLTPVLTQVTDALGDGSRAVIDEDDQYEVFNNPEASDPSHSMLSKDHFDNILNDPAGKVAKVVVEIAVNKIVACWSDESADVDQTITEVLQALHHPYFTVQRSQMQEGMRQTIEKWYQGLGSENDKKVVTDRLTKESVKEGRNKRIGADESIPMHSQSCGKHARAGTGQKSQKRGFKPPSSQPPAGSGAQGYGGGAYGAQQTYGSRNDDEPKRGQYGAQESHSRRNEEDSSYGRSGGRRDQDNSYGRSTEQSYGGGYGGGNRQTDDYQKPSYGGDNNREQPSYGGYSQDNTYSSGRRERDDKPSYGRTEYGQRQEEQQHSYGQRRDRDEESGYRRQQETYGGSGGYGETRSGGYGETRSSGYGETRSSGYGETRSGGYGESHSGGYGETRSGGYGETRSGGGYGETRSAHGESRYGESRSGGYGDSGGYGGNQSRRDDDDGSYGVGRMRIKDDDDDNGRRQYGRRRDDDGDRY